VRETAFSIRGHKMTTEEKIKAYLDEKKLQGGRK
jgi:hypothetical protein